MSLFDRFSSATGKGRKGRRTTESRTTRGRPGKKAAGKKAAGKAAGLRRRPGAALLIAALVIAGVGVGMLQWARTERGQAALLTLGADARFADVQEAIDTALAGTLPGFRRGPADDPRDHDWPAPDLGAGALIRCRVVAVAADETWWEVQARVKAALAPVGGKVLWGERLVPERSRGAATAPDERRDLLRLDVGVVGRPTHTLVLVRPETDRAVRWDGGAGLSRWREFLGAEGPVIALVIDEWGHGKTAAAMDLLRLDIPLTLAVLPELPYSRYFSLQGTDLVLPPGRVAANGAGDAPAARAACLAAGCPVEVSVDPAPAAWPGVRREVMLHLPMEPEGYPATDPGPDAVLVGMTESEVAARLDTALASLAGATGVNNHMGSAATADAATMRAVMRVLRDRDLLFVDSLTSPASVAYAEARRAGVPTARNRIFLDYENENESAIAANLARLVQAARAAGSSLGIAHPHPATAAVLGREIPRLVRQGVRFVTVSELIALREASEQVAAAGGGD